MGTGLSLDQAKLIIDAACKTQQNHDAFVADPKGFIDQLGIDSATVLAECATFKGVAPSFEQMCAQRDAMAGRLLTAHLAFTIHNLS